MPKCRRCGETSHQTKKGFTVNRRQQYRCASCGLIYAPGTKMVYTQEQKEKILEVLQKTEDITLVANTYGITTKTIRTWYIVKYGSLLRWRGLWLYALTAVHINIRPKRVTRGWEIKGVAACIASTDILPIPADIMKLQEKGRLKSL